MKNRTLDNPANCGAQKGASLVVGLLITMVLAIIGVNAAKSSVAQQRMANNYRFSIEAMNNAEVGYISALNQINDQNLSLNGFDDELDENGDGIFNDRFSLTLANQDSNVFFNVVMVDDDDGDGNPSVDSNGIVRLMSQGTSNFGSTRTIEVRIAAAVGVGGPVSVDNSILTEGSIVFSGNSEIYGSNQDIHSNGDVDQADHLTMAGVLSAVGTVGGVVNGGGTVESNAAYIDIPQVEPSDFAEYADYIFDSDGKIYDADGYFVANADGTTWNGWKFNGEKWTSEEGVVQGGMLYFRGQYGNVIISTNTGTVSDRWLISILADGYIEISGNPVFGNYMDPDDPLDVQAIMFMSGADIKINGNANQRYNGIIAAREQFDISGNPTIEGALISEGASNDSGEVEKNSISGNIMMTYNGGLSFPWVPGNSDGTAIILSWRDREIARNTGVFNPVVAGNGY